MRSLLFPLSFLFLAYYKLVNEFYEKCLLLKKKAHEQLYVLLNFCVPPEAWLSCL